MWKTGRSWGTWQVHGSISLFCCQLPPSAPGSVQLISKPRNEAQIKAQWQSKSAIQLVSKCSKKQSKNQVSVSVPLASLLPDILWSHSLTNIFETSFLSKNRLSWLELNCLNQTADDLQLSPPHLPDQGGETDPSTICPLDPCHTLTFTGIVRPRDIHTNIQIIRSYTMFWRNCSQLHWESFFWVQVLLCSCTTHKGSGWWAYKSDAAKYVCRFQMLKKTWLCKCFMKKMPSTHF